MFGAIQRLRQGCRRVYAAPEWIRHAGVDWADTIFDLPLSDRFFAKQGRSIARWSLGSAEQPFVVYLKRHIELPRWHGLATALAPSSRWSPGWEEFHNLQTAANLGIPVPRVVAAAEFLRPGGRLQSVLAVEELSGMIPFNEAIPLAARRHAPAAFANWKAGLIAEMVRLVRLLHDQHWFHKDLYFCHFYMPEVNTHRTPETWNGRIHMIDFHRMRQHVATSSWWTAKDLGQLLFSSEVEGVTERDRVRFWELYTEGRTNSRLVRTIVLLRARNHRRHNTRRPQSSAKAA